MPLPALDPARAVPLVSGELPWDEPIATLWYDAEGLTLAGKAWPEESRRYERFPRRAEGKIPEKPWYQSLACAGLSLRFETDAPFLFCRMIDYDGKPVMKQSPFNLPSLYVRHAGRWQWLGIARQQGETASHLLIKGLPPGNREYLLYLSLGRGMRKLELGIPKDAVLRPSAPRTEKPVVFYGTSINHGGNASKPGVNHIALLERRFDYPFINLGLSGSARMEPEVIDLVNELDARIFVIDCLPNMMAPEVRERFAPAIRKLRASHPQTPIVVVDNIIYQDAFLVPERYARYTESNAAQQHEFARLVAEGMTGLHYIHAHELFTDADEATVDGTHPNDHGFFLMAQAIGKVLVRLLE